MDNLLLIMETLYLEDLSDVNPFNYNVWEGVTTPITKEEIHEAIHNNKLLNKHFSPVVVWTREEHIQRIAYLVVNPCNKPIQIYYHLMRRIVMDGNHRLCAAFFRNDILINSIDYQTA